MSGKPLLPSEVKPYPYKASCHSCTGEVGPAKGWASLPGLPGSCRRLACASAEALRRLLPLSGVLCSGASGLSASSTTCGLLPALHRFRCVSPLCGSFQHPFP